MASQPNDFPASPPELPADAPPLEEPVRDPGEIEPILPDRLEPILP